MSLALLAISMVAILEGILHDDGAKRYLMSSRSKVIDGVSSDLHRGNSSGEPVVPFQKFGAGICTFHIFPDCAWCFVHVCITRLDMPVHVKKVLCICQSRKIPLRPTAVSPAVFPAWARVSGCTGTRHQQFIRLNAHDGCRAWSREASGCPPDDGTQFNLLSREVASPNRRI